MTLTFLLCWTPVLLLAVLAVGFKRPALDLSIVGNVFTLLLVVFYFDTPLSVVLWAALDGVLTTLPLLLVVFAGILLSNLLMTTGSLTRIVTWLADSVRNRLHRELLIVLGVGNFMEGAGVIAEPVVAPMLRAAGVGPMGAAALSVIGYAGLMTLELAGIIVTVLALVTGLPVQELSLAAAWLSIPATVMMAACVPLFLPNAVERRRRFFLPVVCGFFVSLVALWVTVALGVSLSGMLGGLALIVVLALLGTRRLAINKTVLCDLAPFGFVLAALSLVNAVPLLKHWTFERLVFVTQLLPVHEITFRPLFSPYLYLLGASLVTVLLFRVSASELRPVLTKTGKIGLRVSITMGLFGAMGQMIAFSGYAHGLIEVDSARNIPWLLANGIEGCSGDFYPVFVPVLGWVGTFLTGYGVASLMLFGQLQVESAEILGLSATWMAAALAVGASLGSISSPFKIALATPMCGAVGQEGRILRWTIPLGLAASLLIGLILWVVA